MAVDKAVEYHGWVCWEVDDVGYIEPVFLATTLFSEEDHLCDLKKDPNWCLGCQVINYVYITDEIYDVGC